MIRIGFVPAPSPRIYIAEPPQLLSGEFLRIPVTQKHIDAAYGPYPQHCPIALAIPFRCFVFTISIRLNLEDKQPAWNYSPDLHWAVSMYNAAGVMSPFTLVLTGDNQAYREIP